MYAIGKLTDVYERLEKPDSVERYIRLQLEGSRHLDEKKHIFVHLGLYDDLGDFYTKKGILRKRSSTFLLLLSS